MYQTKVPKPKLIYQFTPYERKWGHLHLDDHPTNIPNNGKILAIHDTLIQGAQPESKIAKFLESQKLVVHTDLIYLGTCRHIRSPILYYIFWFKSPETAILFKLTYDGLATDDLV